MGVQGRTEFQQQVVEALLDSKAIDFEAVGSLVSKFGDEAARRGEFLVHIINQHVTWACGWPGPVLDINPGQLDVPGQL